MTDSINEPESGMELLQAWAAWCPGSPPHTLDADRMALTSSKSADSVTIIRSWKEAFEDGNFPFRGDTKLHLGLLPQPFCGDLRRASVFVLSLNPGLEPPDYYGEYKVPAYRSALLNNLKQESFGSIPFFFLDPQYSWHSGFRWWHRKLEGVIGELAKKMKAKKGTSSLAEARAWLGRKLASVELLPYHSASFRARGGWLDRRQGLRSVRLARAFVQQRIRRPGALVIITRGVKHWDLTDGSHGSQVIKFRPGEALGARLTPGSRGGEANPRALAEDAAILTKRRRICFSERARRALRLRSG
jgi:hypothetical protein